MAWTVLSWLSGAIPTSAELTAMQENFNAIAQDETGAPEIKALAIQDSSVQGDKINRTSIGSEALYTIPTLSSWTPSACWMEYFSEGAYIGCANIQIYYAGSWNTSFFYSMGLSIFDSTNIRISNTSSTLASDIYYRIIGG